MSEISERFTKAIDKKELKNADISKKYGISRQNVNNFLTKQKTMTPKFAEICDGENININWLLTGNGKMFLNSEKSVNTSSNSNLVEITYFKDSYAAAGAGAINYDSAPVAMAFDTEFLRVQLGITTFKHIHIINAIGNSMYPTINTGELLFINPFENEDYKIKDKDIYVVNTPNGVLVKRIKIHPIKPIYTLVSDNIDDEDIILEGDEFESCNVIGRVVGHFSGL